MMVIPTQYQRLLDIYIKQAEDSTLFVLGAVQDMETACSGGLKKLLKAAEEAGSMAGITFPLFREGREIFEALGPPMLKAQQDIAAASVRTFFRSLKSAWKFPAGTSDAG